MSTTAVLRGPRAANTSQNTGGLPPFVEPGRQVAVASPAAATPGDELRLALHWTRPDGTPCFTPGRDAALTAGTWQRLKQWTRESGDAEIRTLARVAGLRNGKPAASLRAAPKPPPSYHAPSLQRSVLRTDWSSRAAQLAIDWSAPEMRVELTVGRDVVLSGLAPPHVVAGRQRAPLGAWRENYWVADDGADALELEMQLGDLRLQRQFVLSRRDGLLWIADAVYDAPRGTLECALSLPLAPGVRCTEAEETREATIAVGRRRLLVVPPSLGEWRVDRRSGTLSEADGSIVLRQSHEHAVAAYAPLCFVLDSRRAKRACTWRQLTVGEDMQIQPPDRAVGYRVQLGGENWLVYRSLTPRANRTLLGVNLQDDFLMGRLKKDGTIETLMGIEDD